jgi:predicted metal-dependent phosphoesterase TrpH
MKSDDIFLFETHSHSTASDGALEPDELVRLAIKKGIRVLSITDHDTFRGSSLALRFARVLQKPDLIIVPGAEIRTDHGDILVWCEQPYSRFPFELEDLIDWARERNCVIAPAHPYHYGRHNIGRRIVDFIHLFDAVEAWNSRGLPLFTFTLSYLLF